MRAALAAVGLAAAALRCHSPTVETGPKYLLDYTEVLPATGFCHQFHGRPACCSAEYALAVEAKVRGLQRRAERLHGPCVDRLFRLYTGVACSLCAPDWHRFAVQEHGSWTLQLKAENCDYLWDGCAALVPDMTQEAFCGQVTELGANGFFEALSAPTDGQTFAPTPGTVPNETVVYHAKHALHSHHVHRHAITRVVHERKRRALALVEVREVRRVLRGGSRHVRQGEEPEELVSADDAGADAAATDANADAATDAAATAATADAAATDAATADADGGASDAADAADAADSEGSDADAADSDASDDDADAAAGAAGVNASEPEAAAGNATLEDLARVAELEQELERRRHPEKNATAEPNTTCTLPLPHVRFVHAASRRSLSAVDEGDFAGYDWPPSCAAMVLFALW